MAKTENEVYAAMTERGLIRPSWTVKIVEVERVDRDWATLHVEVYKPHGKVPYAVWELAVYLPKKQIYWDKSKTVF